MTNSSASIETRELPVTLGQDVGDFDRQLAQARQGDVQAKAAILHACQQYLLFIADAELDDRLRGKCGPSDIVQSTFLNATAAFDQFRGDSEAALHAWLRGILKNEVATTSRHYLGTAKRDVRRETDPGGPYPQGDPSQSFVDPQQTPATEAVWNEDMLELRLALRTLPETYRRVLQLRNWDRLSFAEISRLMEKSENAVKKLWARAILRLESQMRSTHE